MLSPTKRSQHGRNRDPIWSQPVLHNEKIYNNLNLSIMNIIETYKPTL